MNIKEALDMTGEDPVTIRICTNDYKFQVDYNIGATVADGSIHHQKDIEEFNQMINNYEKTIPSENRDTTIALKLFDGIDISKHSMEISSDTGLLLMHYFYAESYNKL